MWCLASGDGKARNCAGLTRPKDIYAHQGVAFDRQGIVRVTLPSQDDQPAAVRLAGQVLQLHHFTMDIG
ncbi:hypothetical protein N473_16255 [Pseudoalteromonas luteoviolacea CPMOR-1]|uniref:Uncharacterized protein n=1 Tax=Pseudoalteromonas luteoviolacea CPMOR-1 TaxID=1365248 RepID=A0A167L2W9_9GAMM|nr:hypothetical protein [Pseudoalteromonas luteoviolacea]KZN63719.1 hypothetical protein N473_16255 [Pseudoalteromonas luteoviolacea CPMOR-1]